MFVLQSYHSSLTQFPLPDQLLFPRKHILTPTQQLSAPQKAQTGTVERAQRHEPNPANCSTGTDRRYSSTSWEREPSRSRKCRTLASSSEIRSELCAKTSLWGTAENTHIMNLYINSRDQVPTMKAPVRTVAVRSASSPCALNIAVCSVSHSMLFSLRLCRNDTTSSAAASAFACKLVTGHTNRLDRLPAFSERGTQSSHKL